MVHSLDSLLQFLRRLLQCVLADVGVGLPQLVLDGSVLVLRYVRAVECPLLYLSHELLNVLVCGKRDVAHSISIVLLEGLADIRHHRPVQVGRRHATKLLKALELEYHGDELHRSVDGASRAHVSLTGVEARGKQLVKRNRKAVVGAYGVCVEVVDVDLVVVVVVPRLFRDELLERIALRHEARGLAHSPTKAELVHVCVLVLDVACRQLLCEELGVPDALLLVAVCDVLLRHLVAGSLHQLLLDDILQDVDVDWLFQSVAKRDHCISYSLQLLWGQLLVRLYVVVCLYYRVQYLLWFEVFNLSVALDYRHVCPLVK